MDITIHTPKKSESKVSHSNSNYKDGPSQEMLKHQQRVIMEMQQKQMFKHFEK